MSVLAPNSAIRVAGLTGRPELNGKIGVVTSYVASKGRWLVALDGVAEGSQTLGLRPENLELTWNPSCGDCSICLEVLEAASSPLQGLECGHTVHSECCDFLLEHGGEHVCPLCRRSYAASRSVQWLVDEAMTLHVQSRSQELDEDQEQALTSHAHLLLLEATEADTDDAPTIFNLGEALEEHGDSDKAIEAYRKAIALDSSDASFHCGLGALLGECGDIAGACEAFRAAAAANPSHVDAFCMLGELLHQQGDTGAALEAFREACRVDPDDENARRSLDMMLAKTQSSDGAVAS